MGQTLRWRVGEIDWGEGVKQQKPVQLVLVVCLLPGWCFEMQLCGRGQGEGSVKC